MITKLVFLGGEDVSSRIEISKEFTKLGYDVSVIGSEEESKFIKNRIPYERYSLNRELNIIDDINTLLRLRKILKTKTQKTIVQAFDTKPTMFLPIASIGLKNIKVIRTINGMGRIFTDDTLKNKLLRGIYILIQKLISYKVDFTVFQNKDDYEYFLTNGLVSKNSVKLIKSSGINLSKIKDNTEENKLLKEELNISKDQMTFIFVSRLIKQKGVLNYLEAAKLCYSNGDKCKFLLVGQLDAKDNEITLEKIKQYSPFVSYLGRREDVLDLLSISDVFVLPTYYREGVPRVLLEASAKGLPLIATDMPGCKDVLVDGYNGKLVNIKDTVDLYHKIKYMIDNRNILDKYSKNAKTKVKEFSLDKIANAYHSVYASI